MNRKSPVHAHLAAIVATVLTLASTTPARAAQVGAAAPDFHGTDSTGKTQSLDPSHSGDLRHPVVQELRLRSIVRGHEREGSADSGDSSVWMLGEVLAVSRLRENHSSEGYGVREHL